MPTILPHTQRSRREGDPSIVSTSIWSTGLLCIPMVAIGLTAVLPEMLVLPVVAAIAVVAGFTLEAFRRLARSVAPELAMRLREVAAGLVLIGFAATILADGEQAARAFETAPQSAASSTAR